METHGSVAFLVVFTLGLVDIKAQTVNGKWFLLLYYLEANRGILHHSVASTNYSPSHHISSVERKKVVCAFSPFSRKSNFVLRFPLCFIVFDILFLS